MPNRESLEIKWDANIMLSLRYMYVKDNRTTGRSANFSLPSIKVWHCIQTTRIFFDRPAIYSNEILPLFAGSDANREA